MTTTSTRTTAKMPPRDDRKEVADILERFPSTERLMNVQLELSEDERKRHQVFLLLAMRLVKRFWNGNYRGATGTYPGRPLQRTGELYEDGKKVSDLYDHGADFFGYNIAALAVDGDHNVIDFDFNHNILFKSSMEHAEARLMRRLFNLTGLRSEWSLGTNDDTPNDRFATNLSDVTIYTTLEPCAQCSGIMALARVKEVVYLQPDLGARNIANILYNLKPYGFGVKPIPALNCGIVHGHTLQEKCDAFWENVQNLEPFYISLKGEEDREPRLTKFLCTDEAREIFNAGAQEFDALHSEFAPDVDLKKVKEFSEYAADSHRGTPH
jgi:tRNA(Arg) A34 adenosine deaminase TadA